MKKITLILAVAAFSLVTGEVAAQDKPAATEERSAENIKKEAEALKNRINAYTEKVEANKNSEKMDYEAEKANIAKMIVKWEELTGKSWERQKMIDKM